MSIWYELFIDLVIILILILGIRQFRFPKGARHGNITAALALAGAIVVVVLRHHILEPEIVIGTMLVGSVIGVGIAVRVNMIQIPAMVAFQHGAGGVAAFLVSFVELTRSADPGTSVGKVSGILGLAIGAATFSGSMIASGKLANVLKQPPILLPKHSWIVFGVVILSVFLGFVAGYSEGRPLVITLLILLTLSVLFGLVFSIRIGGADMPVLISFLNATAGLAAAFCGVIIQNRLLIACGATVAASGSILTHVMCKAMNRNLLKVFIGFQEKVAFDWTASLSTGEGDQEDSVSPMAKEVQVSSDPREKKSPLTEAVEVIKESKKIVIIPGYGMALGQAQFKVVELTGLLERLGKEVTFGIHPVAGRMPGHMNVLLAEAEVPYDKLLEMDQVNPQLKDADVALIIGACDVVNPAAMSLEDTPISGMPILRAHEARRVLVCNLDEKPGYSGVENLLYDAEKTILLLGDAKETLETLIHGVNGDPGGGQ
jgi:NAD(P) transhydrogenase subunit beta